MKPIYQTNNTAEEGNSLTACLTSILEDDIESYPTIPENGTWLGVVNDYLYTKGYVIVIFLSVPPKEFNSHYIAVVHNHTKNCDHAFVIKEGAIVHNPSISTDDYSDPMYYIGLLKMIDLP